MYEARIELVQLRDAKNADVFGQKVILRMNLAGLQLLREQIMGVTTEYENRQLVYGTAERSMITSTVGTLGNGGTLRVELEPDEGVVTAEIEKAPAIEADTDVPKRDGKTFQIEGNKPVVVGDHIDAEVIPAQKKTYRIVEKKHLEVDGDDTIYDVATVGIDGDSAFALLGPNLQEGEADFVQIPAPNGKDDVRTQKMWACQKAMWNLRERLQMPNLTYVMDRSHPNWIA